MVSSTAAESAAGFAVFVGGVAAGVGAGATVCAGGGGRTGASVGAGGAIGGVGALTTTRAMGGFGIGGGGGFGAPGVELLAARSASSSAVATSMSSLRLLASLMLP